MKSLEFAGRYCRAIVAIVLAAFIVLGTSAADADWLQTEVGGYRTYYWNTLLNPKFQYNLGTSQWWHYSSVGTNWYTLSATGRPEAFIGDGAYHDLGNGFNYSYLSTYNSGWFLKGSAGRFTYAYTSGQWGTYSKYGGWQTLGNAGLSASFMGDGAYHDLGSGFNFTYLTAYDSSYFLRGSAGRFSYLYTPGQWRTYSKYGGWQTLGNAGLSASFMGDGAYHNLSNGFWYKYLLGTDDAYASVDGTIGGDRFYYLYGAGLWQHRGAMGGWFNLGNRGRNASFIADGQPHDLGNGFLYSYVAGLGTWTKGGAQRFQYAYGTGEWSHRGASGGWNPLGPEDTLSEFLGDGKQYDLGNGFFYSYVGDQGYWTRAGEQRFRYDYAGGQWNHLGGVGGWNLLGAALQSTAFVGDGQPFDMLNGFSFVYTYSSDMGSFFQGATERFQYLYAAGVGQWSHYGQHGGWQVLASGLSSDFVGAGGPHSLGTGWAYSYDEPTSTGFWLSESLGFTKFSYDYTRGQWWDHDKFANQYELGPAANSLAEFMGSGTPHVLDATWSYLFDGTYGRWLAGGNSRFQYAYDMGVWAHYGNVGSAYDISSTDRTGQFIGTYTSLAPLDLGNGFSYWFESGAGLGHWLNTVGGASRFDYDYGDGSWWHYGNVGGIYALSGTGNTGKFLADYTSGSPLDLANGFSYWYESGTGLGHWLVTVGGASRFDYNYGDGSWWHYGPVGGAFALSGTGNTAQFIADYTTGLPLDLGNGFSYWYDGGGLGHWQLTAGGAERFSYDYAFGKWLHAGNAGGSWDLSAVDQSADFVGTVTPHSLGNGFSYYYTGDTGYWKVDGAPTNRFEYTYGAGVWSHYDFFGTPTPLTAAGANAQFWGDGHLAPYDANFSYWYDALLDRGYFALTATSADRFGYDYGSGQWGDVTNVRVWKALGAAGQTLAFIGDGTPYDLGGGLTYQYLPDPTADKGSFSFDTTHQFRQTYTTGAWEYLHDTNVWSPWSALTAPPGTFSGMSAAPSTGQVGIIGGSVWWISSNVLYSWNGNVIENESVATGTFTTLSALGIAGTSQYYLGYGGTSGTGYKIYLFDGTSLQSVSGVNNWGTTTWVGAIGDVPYFRINGGTGHTGWDLFNWSGGTFNNLSATGFKTMDLLTTAGGAFYFSGDTGASSSSYIFGLYSYDGTTWDMKSDTTYGGTIAYLAALNNELLFNVATSMSTGFPQGPYRLFGLNGDTWALRSVDGGGTQINYSTISYLTQVNDAVFFKIGGGLSGTGMDLAAYDGTTWQELSDVNFVSNVIYLTAIGSTLDTVTLYFDGQSVSQHNVWTWDSTNGALQRSNAAGGGGNFTNISYLGTAGGDVFFNGYGGQINGVNHSAWDLFVWDDNANWLTGTNYSLGSAPAFLKALGADGFFLINRAAPNYGDVYRWSGSTLTNISNMASSSITYLPTSMSTDLYFSVYGGTGHSGYDVFRWNGTWDNVSNLGGATAMSYLSSLGPDMYFSVMGGPTGSGYDLYRLSGATWSELSGNKNFSTLSLLAVDGSSGFFLGIDGSGRSVYRWNGSAFTRMDTAPPSSIASPYVIYNGDILWFQYGRVGGPTNVWFPGLLWNSYYDFLTGRI